MSHSVASTNFGGNVAIRPRQVIVPRSENELLRALAECRGRPIRAIGRLHSWSAAAAPDDVLVDLRHLNSVKIEEQGESARVIVGGGCQIQRLVDELARQGWTTPSLGLITQQTIAGAIATGTHGSGRHSLSHYPLELRIAGYDERGEPVVRTLAEGTELLAARCAVGCLGIVVSVTLPCRRAYLVEEHARGYPCLEDVLAAEGEYPLQQFFLVPWLWKYLVQHRCEARGRRSWWAGFYRAYWLLGIDIGYHLLIRLMTQTLRSSSLVRTYYRHIVPWVVPRGLKVTDASHRMLVMKHELFRHIEIEILVPRSRLIEAARFSAEALRYFGGEREALSEETRHALGRLGMVEVLDGNCGRYVHHYPICFRRVLPDETLISMAQGDEPWYAMSFISYARVDEREGFFRMAEFLAKAMAALYGARPHWGKVCPLSGEEIARLYPRLEEFREVCQRFDPGGVFRNGFVNDLLFAGESRP